MNCYDDNECYRQVSSAFWLYDLSGLENKLKRGQLFTLTGFVLTKRIPMLHTNALTPIARKATL